MKYNVKDLFEQTKALEDRYYAIDERRKQEWFEQQLPRWQALRDMITQAIRSKRIITRGDAQSRRVDGLASPLRMDKNDDALP